MEGIYWESDSFSDLDGTWSPRSSPGQYSEKDPYSHHSQHQQPQDENVPGYYSQTLGQNATELLDISSAINQAYGTYCQQGQLQTGDNSASPQQQQSCLQNQIQTSPSSSTSSSGSVSSNNSKKPKNPVKRVHQRNAANMRERRRMKTINDAFEGLRERIPFVSGDRKLSKVDTLRLAIRYIHQLTDMVNTTGSSQAGHARDMEAAKVIIRCHNSGYVDPYSETGYAPEQFPLYGHSLSWQGHKPMTMCPQENKMAAKVWTPQIASSQDIEEMQSYVS